MSESTRLIKLPFKRQAIHRHVLVILIVMIAATASTQILLADSPLKVFLLVGQSNMEGKGNPLHLDTYKDDPVIAPSYASLKDGDAWRVRDDVWITYPSNAKGAKHGRLTVGYGTKGPDSIGPEFGFGHAIGNSCQEPVLLIKVAWGGKSLGVDFRPPSVPPSEEEVEELLQRARKKAPATTKDEIVAKFGHFYREMLRHVEAEMNNIGERFPELADRSPQLSGFVWHQGFNDKVNRRLRESKYADYTVWLDAFIRDVRKDLDAPQLPFVIGELSTGGIPARGDFQIAQANVAKSPDFENNVAFVPTAEFYDTEAHKLFIENYWKGTAEQKAEWQKVGNDRPYHYLGSGKTYYLKGLAFADAVLELMH